MRIRSVVSHGLQAVAEGALIALLIVGLMAGTTFAARSGGGGGGKPGGGGTSGSGTLSLVMVYDAIGNGLPNYADVITFNVSTSASTPIVVVNCYQSGSWVYSAQAGFYPSYAWAPNYTLASAMWTAGGASCTATLESYNNSKYTTLATLTFSVAA